MTAEILDVATRNTIEESPAIKAIADFIVVNDLAARLIAAVADRREVSRVLEELLGPDVNSQVKVWRPALNELKAGATLKHWTLLPRVGRQCCSGLNLSAFFLKNACLYLN